jgi:hypothetical protein
MLGALSECTGSGPGESPGGNQDRSEGDDRTASLHGLTSITLGVPDVDTGAANPMINITGTDLRLHAAVAA